MWNGLKARVMSTICYVMKTLNVSFQIFAELYILTDMLFFFFQANQIKQNSQEYT